MLEKSDLMAIENMFDRLEEKIDQKLDQRFTEFDKTMDKKLDERFAKYDKSMDKKFAKMEKMDLFLLDEIERNRNILETRMDRMQQDMDDVKSEIRQLYRITGVENERMDMEIEELRQNDLELGERVTRLENRAMA